MITKIDAHNNDRIRIDLKFMIMRLKLDTMVQNKDWCHNVYNQYTVLVNQRESVVNKLKIKILRLA